MAPRPSWPPQAEVALQLDHGKTRMGRFTALVLLVRPRPRERLRLVLDGENAEADGELMLDRKLLQTPRAFAADIIVVRRLAADDAAECDVAVKACFTRAARLGLDGKADGGGNLEGTGHGETLVARPGRIERRDCAARQLVGDMRVISRLDEHDMRRLRHHAPPGRSIARWPTTARP